MRKPKAARIQIVDCHNSNRAVGQPIAGMDKVLAELAQLELAAGSPLVKRYSYTSAWVFQNFMA